MKKHNKKLKLFFVFAVGIILLSVVSIGIQIAIEIAFVEVRDRVYLHGNLNWATDSAYQIFVEEGQIPYQATCTVMDSQGHPIPGMIVALGGYSGTREDMITNDQGQVTQSCIEDVIIQIWVNEICAFWKYDTVWYQPSYMPVDKGLMIKIIMMNLRNEPKNQILSGCSRSVDADPQKMESDSISTANRDITVKESSYPEKNMTIKKTYRGSDVIMQETDIDGVKTISYSINGKCVCIEADEDKDGSFECISIFDPDTDEFEIFYREKDGSVHPMEPKELQEMRQKTQEASQAMKDYIDATVGGSKIP